MSAVGAFLRHNARSLTGHLNRGIYGVFEIVRVVGRGLVSIAEVHAIVARAYFAQSEPEVARDRFGFLERHGFLNCHREVAAVEVPAKSHLPRLKDLDGLDIRIFAPAAGIAFGQRTASHPFGVAAGRDALGPELARRVRGEMDHDAMRVDVARATALVHFAVSIGGLELDAHELLRHEVS